LFLLLVKIELDRLVTKQVAHDSRGKSKERDEDDWSQGGVAIIKYFRTIIHN